MNSKNPERIHRIMAKLEACWQDSSDFRLCQLLEDIIANNGDSPHCIFYIADSDLEYAIDEWARFVGCELPDSL